MLMQWAEERLALAQSLLGLLELHAAQATRDIAAFDSELQAQHANMDGGMLDVYPSPADLRKQQVADIQAKRQGQVTAILCWAVMICHTLITVVYT